MNKNPGPLSPRMASVQADRLHSVVGDLATAFARAKQAYIKEFPLCPRPIVTCGWRSNEEQARLYQQGRTTPGPIVTHAQAGQSKHNKSPSEALDIGFLDEDLELDWTAQQFREFARLMKAENELIIWGGDWPGKKRDRPHFQLGR